MSIDTDVFFDNIKFGIAVYSALDNGKDFVFVDFNKGAEKIENLSREDIIGKSVAEVFPDITGFGLFEVFQRVWRTGVPEHHPVSRYKDNRIWGWRDNYIYKLSNREIVAVYTDETDREETRLALNKSEERFRLMFERSSDGILLIDNGKFIDCNEAAVKLFGFSHKKELLGLEPADLSPEKQPNGSLSSSKADELISKALSSNTLRFEWLHVDKNGKKIPVEALLIPIPLNGGKVLFTLLRDISERTLAQESIKISEANYRALFNSTDDAILVQSSDTGYFIDANQKMIEMFSLSFEEFRFLDQNSISILCNSESSSTKRELDDRFEKAVHGNAQVFELHMRGKNKTPFWVEVHLKCAQINDKSVLLWNFRDISDRKQNQTARKNLEVQLQQAQKMEAIGTLASGIAHDFNNILMAIMGNAEMAQDQLLPGTPENKCIDQIIKGCHRATKLVRQILHFASQSDNVSIPVKVGNIVDEVSNLLRSSLPRNIDILQNVKSERDSVLGVSIQIHQVLMNLCTNAYHAMMEEGGVLEICLENITLPVEKLAMPSKQTPGEYLRLQVRDTGCGMSKETIMRIFDPYFTTKGKDIGTGLGLSVVHGIVQSHGGFINVDSEIGHGTVFNIYFPLIDILAEPESKTGALIPGGKERVLFVDDEESLANLGTRMLHRLGYEVTTRVSPVEALEAFKYKPDGFDLVITDMNMPNMSGVELAVELNCIRSDIPIVLCTGFSETLTESKAREMGISSIIMKPFIMRDLAGIIREVLDEKVI